MDEYAPSSLRRKEARKAGSMSPDELKEHLSAFVPAFKRTEAIKTEIERNKIDGIEISIYSNEFWTSRQRQACSLHEISYRACFKPQLPRFFIEALTEEGEVVYDPFSGRGTTAIEAALMNRSSIANDINPLSEILASPRVRPPKHSDVRLRLEQIPFKKDQKSEIDLSMFFHRDTEGEIVSLREYLRTRRASGAEDDVDRWIRMVATNRLTGHSTGFFSVYSLPPNQAASQESQRKINRKLDQTPEYRDVKRIILKKSKQLLSEIGEKERRNLENPGNSHLFLCADARGTVQISSDSVRLTVTSPPFLDIVQYSSDNWLRCWFNDIDVGVVAKRITMSRTVEEWTRVMVDVFRELYRVTAKGGWVAFEVGEIRKGSIKLDEYVVPLGGAAGFSCFGVIVNSQTFTKTSNIWGINNNQGGTNTNRIVLFYKE